MSAGPACRSLAAENRLSLLIPYSDKGPVKRMRAIVHSAAVPGFSLIETMLALLVLAFGLLTVGQLLHATAASGSLSRSKGTAAVAAQDMLESLAALYARDPAATELAPGNHGPRRTQTVHPVDGTVLNRYDLTWEVAAVADPRPGKILKASLVRVTVAPVLDGGLPNNHPGMNKILSVTTILSPEPGGQP